MIERRTIIQGAWAAPVILMTVAAPAEAASREKCKTRTSIANKHDNGTYTVGDGFITVNYSHVPDIYEIQAKGTWGQRNFGTNFGSAPKRGTKSWTVEIPGCPSWVKVHDFNTHYPNNFK